MRPGETFTILLASLFSATAALAAPFQEVVQPQGLLILGGFQQWVSLAYEYTGHDSSIQRASSSTNRFKEKYHFSLNTAILDPHLLSLALDGEAGLQQAKTTDETRGSQSSHDTQYQYNLNGSFFDQSPLPITFLSGRQLSTVVTPFAPTYTSDTFTNGITAVLHNRYTPLLFRYWRVSTDITGLASNYTTTSNNFYLQAEHDIPDLSHSMLTGTVTQQSLETSGLPPTDSRNYSLSASNALTLDRKKKYTLSSSLQGSESQSGDIPQQSLDWLETFDARFGKALWGILDYHYSYDKTLGFDNQDQITSYNEAFGSLTHRLFQSLDTAITGRYRTSEILGGNETIYGGSAGATYRKNLPEESQIMLSVKEEYEVTDRHFSGALLSIRDEEHKGVQQGDSIPLRVTGNSVRVVSVKSHTPDITYVVDIDYSVDEATRNVKIIFGGGIVNGTDLFISYSVQLFPQVKYNTDTFNANLNLSLFKNRYTILGNFNSQNRTTVSSLSGNIDLYNSRSAMLHADANFYPNSFSAEYGMYVSGPTNYSYWEAGWRFDYHFDRQALAFRMRDRYLTRQSSGGTGQDSWENTAEFGTSYSRPVFTWANASATLSYVNTSGADYNRDYAYFRVNFQGQINRLLINLVGQSILRIRPSETARDDYVLLEVKRYF